MTTPLSYLLDILAGSPHTKQRAPQTLEAFDLFEQITVIVEQDWLKAQQLKPGIQPHPRRLRGAKFIDKEVTRILT
jgi:hypothetical protein